MDKSTLKPRDILEMYCYTSELTFDGDGTIYTITDQRTKLNGEKIIKKLTNGEYILTWLS